MALRFIDSCGDYYSTAQLGRKWTANVSGQILAGGGRRAGNALDGSFARSYSRTIDAQGTWVVGFAYKYAAAPASDNQIMILLDVVTEQVSLRMEASTGKLKFTRSGTTLGTVSAAALTTGVEHYIEVKAVIHPSAGTYEVRVDGVAVISGVAQNTRTTANSTADSFRLNTGVSIGACMFDDVYMCDGTGATLNDFLGDVRVDAYLPAADGANSGLTPSTGTSHFALVNENPANDDTNYNSSATVGAKDTYDFANMTHTPVSIFGVQVNMTARKDDAGARSVAAVTRSGGADYDGATQGLSTSYTQYQQIVTLDPNTAAAWTKTALNAAEFGVKVAA